MNRMPATLLGLVVLASPVAGREAAGTLLLQSLAAELGAHTAGQVGETMPLAGDAAEAFGLGTNVTVVQPAAFFPGPGDPDLDYGLNDFAILEGEVSGTVGFWAPLDLPTGALIETVCLVANESDSGGSLNLFLIATEVDATPSYAYPPFTAFVSTGIPETPGWTRVCAPDVEILYQAIADIDGDGTPGNLTYSLLVTFNSDPEDGVDEQQLGAVEIAWRRTMSPAPATASFDDVPTDHLFFQHVEALTASGITAGCDADSYCPDDPLTRGQMAVFLARALGLHWPN
ncbi:MAG: S-layer homology domain-containing protein [Thermoanaerobaculia bacterium]